jgi:hypothetical protein
MEKERIEVHISSLLNEDEWQLLKQFCEKSERLLSTKYLSVDKTNYSASIKYQAGVGVSTRAELPPEEIISEYLMAFRFFYLEKEPTNFLRIVNLLSSKTNNKRVTSAYRSYRAKWKNYLFQKSIVFKVGEDELTTSLLLDLWFNAHYFHSDRAKHKRLEVIKESYSDELAKYMLLDAVSQSSSLIIEIYEGIRPIVQARFS